MITKEGTSSQSKVSSFKSIRLASDSAQGHFLRLEIIKMFPFKKSFAFHCCPPMSLLWTDSKGRHPIFRLSVNHY